MAKYLEYWKSILKKIRKELDPAKPWPVSYLVNELEQLGERDASGYNGYLRLWAGQADGRTASQVFVDLEQAVRDDKAFMALCAGKAEFRITLNNTLTITHQLLTPDDFIERYKGLQATEAGKAEVYKWKLVKANHDVWAQYESGELTFQQYFLKLDFANLVYPLAWGVMKEVAKAEPAAFEQLLLALYDENTELPERLDTFRTAFAALYTKLPEHGVNAFMEGRTMAALLTWRYPERYTIFKDSFYTPYCKALGIRPAKPGEKVPHYLELVRALASEHIPRYEDVIAARDAMLDDTCYRDPGNMILAQDILYMTTRNAEEDEDDAQDGSEAKFLTTLRSFSIEDQRNFLNDLEEITTRIGVAAGDERVVFHAVPGEPRLGFTIGQAYCMQLGSGEGSTYGFALPHKGALPGVEYRKEFKGPNERDYAYTNDHQRVKDHWEEVLTFCQEELTRTERSGHRAKNNPYLEKAVFDPAYRVSILLQDPPRAVNYWIFQGNPAYYDTAGALKAGALESWGVGAHKEKMRSGDKVILWVTGPKAGCYALATVTTAVTRRPPSAADARFYIGSNREALPERVGIRIDHDLGERPLYKEQITSALVMQGFKAGNQGTTFSATADQYQHILQLVKAMSTPDRHPLNTILYGPPGTGKTYHAITHAVAIIDGLPIEEVKAKPRDQVRARYEELAKANHVRTVTFHQSFSYEDFIEGIKPETQAGKEGKDEVKLVTYDVQDGIFKLMCASARSGEQGAAAIELDEHTLQKANFYKVSLGQYNNSADDEIYDHCMVHGVIAVGYGGTVDVSAAKNDVDIRSILKGAGMQEDGEGFGYTISVLKAMHLDMEEGDIVFVSAGNSKVRAIGRVSGGYFMDPNAKIRFKQFRKVEWLYKDVDIPVEDIYGKAFVMGTLYWLKPDLVKKEYFRKKVTSTTKVNGRYVLIIDEINRGNVASIFGELITLIEDDKREGGREAARIRLPYSKEDFSVPANLHLLGTMNTADRSVEALDTALRRRFSFVEMPSQADLIEPAVVGDVDLRALLRTINERVEQLMDKDHHIGHSYFMGLKSDDDLKRMFGTKVIPLLEEYFHGDAKKVGAILGKAFVDVREKTIAFAKGFDMDDYEVKELYTVKDPRKFNDLIPFKAIYAGS